MAVLRQSAWDSLAQGTVSRCFLWVGLMSIVLAASPRVGAETTEAKEYQLKSVFLFYFSQFVDWPAAAFPQANAPLVIGVLGNDRLEGFSTKPCRVKGPTIGPSSCAATAGWRI